MAQPSLVDVCPTAGNVNFWTMPPSYIQVLILLASFSHEVSYSVISTD